MSPRTGAGKPTGTQKRVQRCATPVSWTATGGALLAVHARPKGQPQGRIVAQR